MVCLELSGFRQFPASGNYCKHKVSQRITSALLVSRLTNASQALDTSSEKEALTNAKPEPPLVLKRTDANFPPQEI
jgi:hypothetical protein